MLEWWEQLKILQHFPTPSGVSLPTNPQFFSEPLAFWEMHVLEGGENEMQGGRYGRREGGEKEAGVCGA